MEMDLEDCVSILDNMIENDNSPINYGGKCISKFYNGNISAKIQWKFLDMLDKNPHNWDLQSTEVKCDICEVEYLTDYYIYTAVLPRSQCVCRRCMDNISEYDYLHWNNKCYIKNNYTIHVFDQESELYFEANIYDIPKIRDCFVDINWYTKCKLCDKMGDVCLKSKKLVRRGNNLHDNYCNDCFKFIISLCFDEFSIIFKLPLLSDIHKYILEILFLHNKYLFYHL